MKAALWFVALAACKSTATVDTVIPVDAGYGLNTTDAAVMPRNMCDNTANVLLAPRVDVPVGVGPDGLTVADFNGDGLPDLTIGTEQPGGASFLFNKTPGCMVGFQPFLDLPTQANVHAVVAADFNGDGLPDIAAVSQLLDVVSVRLDTTSKGAPVPVFAASVDFPTLTNPSWVAVGDVNGDGKPDLVASAATGISVLINITAAGAATPAFQDKIDLPHTGETFGVALADFNNDGRLDIAVTDSEANTVSIYLNTTQGTTSFAAPATFPTGMSPFAIAIADFDEDHHPDIAVTNVMDNTVSVLMNMTGSGDTMPTFAPKVDMPTAVRPYAITVGDVNRDGKPDIIAACETTNAISIFLSTNTTGSGFLDKVDVPTGNSPHGVLLTDIDGDGTDDVVVSNNDDSTVSVFLAR